jgi:hypothetical protein
MCNYFKNNYFTRIYSILSTKGERIKRQKDTIREVLVPVNRLTG